VKKSNIYDIVLMFLAKPSATADGRPATKGGLGPHRLSVRTHPSQGWKRSSILREVTRTKMSLNSMFRLSLETFARFTLLLRHNKYISIVYSSFVAIFYRICHPLRKKTIDN
jgi:hypothetical protein